MRVQKEYVTSVGSVLTALLAGSHHWIHMLILALGVGSGAVSGLMTNPLVRHAMLVLSLSMVAYMQITYWRRKHRTWAMTLVVMFSSVMSVGMSFYALIATGGGHH
jgi:hypothetical protein